MKISLAYNNKTKNVFWNTMYFKYYIDYVTLELIIAIFGVFGHLKYYTPLPFFSLMASNISCKVFQSSKGSFWNIKKEILASSTAQYYNNKLRPVWLWFFITIYCIWREPFQAFELDGFSTVSEWNCISQWFNFFLPEVKLQWD